MFDMLAGFFRAEFIRYEIALISFRGEGDGRVCNLEIKLPSV